MKSVKTVILVVSVFTLQLRLGADAQSQEKPIIRPYGRIGFLLTPPSTADLGYSVDGVPGGLDDAQSVDSKEFGLGCQLLMKKSTGLHWGGEIGFQRLFSSKITGDVTSSIYYNYDYDREWEMYLNGLLEFSKRESSLFFQLGSGLHLVHWEWESELSSRYGSDYDSDDGDEVNFGLMAAIGTRLRVGSSMSAPVAVRTDILFRYGIFFQIGLIIGYDL